MVSQAEPFSKNLLFCKWPGCNFSTNSLMMLHEHSLDPNVHVTTIVTDKSVTNVTTDGDATNHDDNFDQNVTNEIVDPLALDPDPLTSFDSDKNSDTELNLKVHEGQKNHAAVHEGHEEVPKRDTNIEDFQTCFIKMENSDSIAEPSASDDVDKNNEFDSYHFIKNGGKCSSCSSKFNKMIRVKFIMILPNSRMIQILLRLCLLILLKP
jgi:hypothetical protein